MGYAATWLKTQDAGSYKKDANQIGMILRTISVGDHHVTREIMSSNKRSHSFNTANFVIIFAKPECLTWVDQVGKETSNIKSGVSQSPTIRHYKGIKMHNPSRSDSEQE